MKHLVFNSSEITPEEIINKPGLFLNPFEKPTIDAIYCVEGTKSQFDEWFESMRTMHSYRQALSVTEPFKEEFEPIRQKFYNNFSHWYSPK